MTVHLNLTLDAAVAAKLDEIAAKTDRSRERVAQDMLGVLIDVEVDHVNAIEEGLAAAVQGKFASDEEVTAVFGRSRATHPDDADLVALSGLMSEWESPEDGKAFDGL